MPTVDTFMKVCSKGDSISMIEYEICSMTTESEMDEKGYVHGKSWQETYEGLMPQEYLENITLEKCIKMAHKWPQNTLLLKVDGNSVGFACVGKSKDTDGADEVIAIYLLKEYQGKKLGYALLKEAVSRLSDSPKIVLWVLKGNDHAIRFYQKFGFSFTGKEKALPFGTELQMEITT